MADFRVVIPARFASTRFPGKALQLLCGTPMVEHVYRRACASNAREVIVATDDARIAEAARKAGADVALTRPDHVSGTDRIAEVVEARGWTEEAIVVNVQGDSPLVPPASVNQVAGLLEDHPAAAIGTLCAPVASTQQYTSPHIVKVVMDQSGRALYFSRAPIPAGAQAGPDQAAAWRHLGIYAYRVGDLRRLSQTEPCYIETSERLEQLRALWLGLEIRVAIAAQSHGPDIDVPEDVAAVETILARDGGVEAWNTCR